MKRNYAFSCWPFSIVRCKISNKMREGDSKLETTFKKILRNLGIENAITANDFHFRCFTENEMLVD